MVSYFEKTDPEKNDYNNFDNLDALLFAKYNNFILNQEKLDNNLYPNKQQIIYSKYILNDWVLCLEIICNGLQCLEGENIVLLEAYIMQILETFFFEQDEDQCKLILEKLVTYLNSSLLCEPEIVVIVHTLFGIIYESKSLVECEQNYMIALLTLHKLSVMVFLGNYFSHGAYPSLPESKAKFNDAAYVEELFDATVINLKRNKLNK